MKEETLTFSKGELFFRLISVKIKSRLLYVALHPFLRTIALMKALCNIKLRNLPTVYLHDLYVNIPCFLRFASIIKPINAYSSQGNKYSSVFFSDNASQSIRLSGEEPRA